MDINRPEVKEQIARYLEEHHLLASYCGLGGTPAKEELILNLNVVREASDGIYVDCHFIFNEIVRVGPGGASHHVHRNGLVHLRLDPETGHVQDGWLR
jgi:hypothetical protein